jgi:Raf kinase inhibitor-like YbhB/YbcL family protein
MRLTSSAFGSGDRIPVRFTCDGTDISPPLAWSDPPNGTRTFALVCADPDAPGGTWYHWAIYDIPAITHVLSEHWPSTRVPPPQGINDFGDVGYRGPCPPPGTPHHYHFRLYALDVARLDLGPGVRCRAVEVAVRAQTIATAELIGIYGRGR